MPSKLSPSAQKRAGMAYNAGKGIHKDDATKYGEDLDSGMSGPAARQRMKTNMVNRRNNQKFDPQKRQVYLEHSHEKVAK